MLKEISAPSKASEQHNSSKTVLRLITCGSVDDGKSTLIGRLLYDAGLLKADQLQQLAILSKAKGTQGGSLDFAFLTDGLEAEIEQGITIDVAYRYFSTPTRKFIVADTPGHEQFTRNMATGASNVDVALLLIDARDGLKSQTRRHAMIASFMGIRQLIAVVNKMDLVGYSGDVFGEICDDLDELADSIALPRFVKIPVSALIGDNVVNPSPRLGWYSGSPLLACLEGFEIASGDCDTSSFRFPVQWVNRPNLNFRGYSGTIASGSVRKGERVVVLPSKESAVVKSIVTFDGTVEKAHALEAITMVLDREISVNRGDVVVSETCQGQAGEHFSAHVVWMGKEPMLPSRSYLIRMGHQWAPACVTKIDHVVNVHTGKFEPAEHLEMNALARVKLTSDVPLVIDPHDQLPRTGRFIIVDRRSNETLGCGMVVKTLERDLRIHAGEHLHDAQKTPRVLPQNGAVLWLTGLPLSGKSTLAKAMAKILGECGIYATVLDFGNIRSGLNRNLGFSDEDRTEHLRRVAEVANILADIGVVVICAFVSPFEADRTRARELIGGARFYEIFVDTEISVCETRDDAGLFEKARAGQLHWFTGVNSPYEVPEQPDFRIDGNGTSSAEELARQCLTSFKLIV